MLSPFLFQGLLGNATGSRLCAILDCLLGFTESLCAVLDRLLGLTESLRYGP